MTTPPASIPTLTQYAATGTITNLEKQALELRFPDWPHTGRCLSTREITLALGVSRTTIRDRITNGLRKIAIHENRRAA
jgi:hypothetical protein